MCFLMSLAGCQSLGPSSISAGRPAYNTAVQQTSNEEMLLNIIRLRYRDTPLFLQVSGIAANVSTEIGLNGGAEIPSTGTTLGSVAATGSYLDNPTVTYAPLQGEEFVTQLLTPVRLDTLLLLIESGWSIERVLRLCANRLNDTRNAPSASGPTPETAPPFEAFRRVASLLRELQNRDAIFFAIEHREPYGLSMRFREDEADSPAALELARLLGVEAGRPRYVFTHRVDGIGGGETIAIETRSLMGSLFYLSQAVEPPSAHEAKRWVTVTRNPDGSAFDWKRVMGGLFRVDSEPPASGSAFLSTSYLGATFHIDRADPDTKATFALLNQLFALQAGAGSGAGPVLTLPVSR